MAMNPMQRKANNSFLLGILITLVITGAIIGFLIYHISNLNSELETQEASRVYGYVVTGQIASGTEITASQIKGIELNIEGDSSTIYSSQTTDAEGNIVADSTGNLFPVGLKAKVDLNPGTVLTTDLTYEDEALTADVRSQEYNVIQLMSQLKSGDYIDVRLRTPEGRDLIVVSHKEVTIPQIARVDSENCIWMDLSEEETLMMSSAIVETYRMNGAKLYATKYVEPGLQEAATTTYVPSAEVEALIRTDPNIVQEAKNALISLYDSNRDLVRQGLDNAVNNEDADDNVVEKTEEEITSLQQERELYIESLGG